MVKFHCPGCRVTFSVADEKIPPGKEVKILCPKCRVPVERMDGDQANGAVRQEEVPEVYTAMGLEEDQEEGESLEFIEEGVKTALICISDLSRSERVVHIAQQLDFHVSAASTAKAAIDKLHRNRYDLVVLDEYFNGTPSSENLVLHHIQFLPMHVRRQFFLCMLSENSRSLDQLIAFRIGVDMILNVQDLGKAKIVLVRAMKDHRNFYKVFSLELERKGQI